MVDTSCPLIFFHFQGLKRGLAGYFQQPPRVSRAVFRDVRKHVYKPYVDELLAIERKLGPILQVSDVKPQRRSAVVDIRQRLEGKMRNMRSRMFQLLDVVTGRAFVVLRGTAY